MKDEDCEPCGCNIEARLVCDAHWKEFKQQLEEAKGEGIMES